QRGRELSCPSGGVAGDLRRKARSERGGVIAHILGGCRAPTCPYIANHASLAQLSIIGNCHHVSPQMATAASAASDTGPSSGSNRPTNADRRYLRELDRAPHE